MITKDSILIIDVALVIHSFLKALYSTIIVLILNYRPFLNPIVVIKSN